MNDTPDLNEVMEIADAVFEKLPQYTLPKDELVELAKRRIDEQLSLRYQNALQQSMMHAQAQHQAELARANAQMNVLGGGIAGAIGANAVGGYAGLGGGSASTTSTLSESTSPQGPSHKGITDKLKELLKDHGIGN